MRLENSLIILNIFLTLNKQIHEKSFIKNTNLIIYIIYFFTWSYILVISFPTLNNIDLTLKLLEIIT